MHTPRNAELLSQLLTTLFGNSWVAWRIPFYSRIMLQQPTTYSLIHLSISPFQQLTVYNFGTAENSTESRKNCF